MHFEYFSPNVPVKVRKPTAHEMEVFIHHASELTRFGMVPYFAPIINEIRVVMINTDKAYVDKDWRVALPEGSLDSFDSRDTPTKMLREVLRLIILQHDRASKNVMNDEEVSRVSFDLEINQRLNGFSGRLKLDRDGEEIVDLLPEDYDLPAFGIAEEYYSTVLSYMRGDEAQGTGNMNAPGGAGANQSGASGASGGSGGSPSGTPIDGEAIEGEIVGSMSGGVSGSGSPSGSQANSNTEQGNETGTSDSEGDEESNSEGEGDSNSSGTSDEADEQGDGSGGGGEETDEEGDEGNESSSGDEESDEEGAGAKAGSSKFVTEAELAAMLDAIGLQRADSQVKRRKRNDMLALVQEEMSSNKSIGSGAGNALLDWVAKSEAGNNTHWAEMLRRVLVIASNQRMPGDTIRTYRRPNFRLQCALPDTRIILPTSYDVRPNVYVGVDTSGSMMNSEDIGRALGNIERIFEEFQTRAEVRISAIDTVLGEFQSVKQIKDIEFTGGGGTDMAPFIEALNSYEGGVDKAHPPATLGILITDGYIDWDDVANALKEKHSYRLAIVLTSKHAEDVVESNRKHFNILPPDARPEIIPVTIYN